jgi:hypothetical protein
MFTFQPGYFELSVCLPATAFVRHTFMHCYTVQIFTFSTLSQPQSRYPLLMPENILPPGTVPKTLLQEISSMFSGTETGWNQFTPEFHIDGTFDRLTPEQCATVFIPSTNDCMLGIYRVHMHHHPSSTANSFSNQTWAERNNTEAFIKKFCNAVVEKCVMREVRKDSASGRRAKFR